MSKYKHLFFDLDRTLWDFETNAKEALLEAYEKFELASSGIDNSKEFIITYKRINERLWASYRIGETDKETLRNERFHKTLLAFGIDNYGLAVRIGNDYLASCPMKTTLIPFAVDVLKYLQHNYQLHILTNGFEETQLTKLEQCKLRPYFKHVVTSEQAGYQKPDRRIFEYALERCRAQANESLMIGDHIEVDIAGARNAGIDQVYYNPTQSLHDKDATYEICALNELKDIL